jgi:GlpG protein
VVANAAHLAGLVSGCLLGGIFGMVRRSQKSRAV